MRRDKEIFAIPMWLNGRAYLKLARDYCDVVNPSNGEILRKTPLFGPAEVADALQSAKQGLSAWLLLGKFERERLLTSLGDALSGLRAHFSGLIVEETGKDVAVAERDVDEMVSCLRKPAMVAVAGSVAVIADSPALLRTVIQVVSALAAGAVVVISPLPRSPSVLFALAELSSRCGFPAGAINVVCLGDAGRACLRGSEGVAVLE